MDAGIWEILRVIVPIILAVVTGFAFFFKKYIARVEKTEDKLVSMEVRLSVVESKITDIRNDLKTIKRGVIKLVDRENAKPR